MKICIIRSMAFTDKMLEVAAQLQAMGHQTVVSGFVDNYAGKSEEDIERLKLEDKHERDAVREFWHKMQDLDAVLCLNFDRKGIAGYIGGNTLMELGFAHVLNLKIFLWNPIPEIEYYKSEIEAVKPVIIVGDLSKIV